MFLELTVHPHNEHEICYFLINFFSELIVNKLSGIYLISSIAEISNNIKIYISQSGIYAIDCFFLSAIYIKQKTVWLKGTRHAM